MMSRPSMGACANRLAIIFFAGLMAPPLLAGVPSPGREAPPPGIEEHSLAVGAPAPVIKLESTMGGTWSLTDALEGGPVALVFYRGDW